MHGSQVSTPSSIKTVLVYVSGKFPIQYRNPCSEPSIVTPEVSMLSLVGEPREYATMGYSLP